jgi:hypothetical protein
MSKRASPPSHLTQLVIATSIASLTGCGAGTAAAVSGGSDGGGSSNALPSISNLTVLDPKLPDQARLRFVLADVESNPADVQFFFQLQGQPREPITQIDRNPASLSTSSDGVEHFLPWNFAAEPSLPDDGSFVEAVRVIAALENGQQEIVLGANDDFGLGNDPPEVHDPLPPASEVDGVVPVRFSVSDSSNDIVSIEVQFDIVGDVPDLGWRLARPGGLLPGQPTPELAFPGVEAPKVPADLVFFWDTDADLAELERDVRVRFTARDEVGPGATVETPVFRVDNNATPIATVSSSLLLNPDERAGIPIPYTVRDDESDDVDVVFQWTHPGEDFSPLPNSRTEIDAILADPLRRSELRICSEYPTWVEGRVVPVDSTSVRLPELTTGASSILTHDVVGRELEIMRLSQVPKPIAATWTSNPLNHPVAAVPIGDGIEALVLDRASPGSWRLRQIVLATGVVTRDLVPTALGEPNAMTLERGEQSALIASDNAGAWQLSRVKLATGEITSLMQFDGTTESGAIRGLVSEGTNSALATVASSLIRLDYSDAQTPRSVTIFDDLSAPWGIALDPFAEGPVFVAEHDAPSSVSNPGRVLVIDLDSRERRVLTFGVNDPSERVVLAPQSLAFDEPLDRLLIVQHPPLEDAMLLGIDVGSSRADASFPISQSLPGSVGAITAGPSGLLVIALTSQNDLAVGGGVEQRRTIDSFELAGQIAHVTEAFAPITLPLQEFRIAARQTVSTASPSGTRGVFVWNSADAPEGGAVLIRATPMDLEKGVDGAIDASKPVRGALDSDPVIVGGESVKYQVQAIATADLDSDGDLDLVSANGISHTLTVFFQMSRGVFSTIPLSLGNASVTNFPVSVATGDLDGDGDLDLVCANSISAALFGESLAIFFQTSPGVFDPVPLLLGSPGLTSGPTCVAAADLDGDGDLDLVSANSSGDNLTVFLQTDPGVFEKNPLQLGSASVTNRPAFVAIADIDGDGALDIVSANKGNNTLTVFFQRSPGVFGTIPLSLGNGSVTGSPNCVASADFDGDGDLDIVSANTISSTLTLFFQITPRVFESAPVTLGDSTVTSFPRSVSPADLDGDGDVDLVSANSNSDTLTVFFQTSPGVFGTTPLSLGGFGVTDGPYSVAPADLDGDGDVDLVSAHLSSDSPTVFFQRSPGIFGTSPRPLVIRSAAQSPQSVVPADLDSDGDLDLVAANLTGGLCVFFQTAAGVFATTPLLIGNGVMLDTESVAAADMDGDGDLDLVARSVLGGLKVFFQTSPGGFDAPALSIGIGSSPLNPKPLACADLDGDGDRDLVWAGQLGSNLTIHFQTRPGVFDTTPLPLGRGVLSAPTSVAAADLNGDGGLDLVATHGSGLIVYFQSNPGVFGTPPLSLGSLSVTPGSRSVAAADFDGDGDLDLVSANEGNDTLTVFFQTSPGVFRTTPLSLGNAGVTNSPASVAPADFDGDGDVDLVSANSGSNTLTVFFQTSPGIFGRTPLSIESPGESSTPVSVAPADLDGDGDLDLVSANYGSSTLTIFWNNH